METRAARSRVDAAPAPGPVSLRGILRAPATHVLLLAAVAFAIRVAVAFAIDVEPLAVGDDVSFYYTAARHLARGDGFVYDWSLLRGPAYNAITATALHAPGYPATLALWFKAFGESARGAYVLNAALGSATVSLVYLLGRRLFGTAQGLAAGMIALFFPGQIYFAAMTMSEVYAAFLVVLLVYLTVAWSDRRLRWWEPPALFLLSGLAGTVRPELVLFPLALAGMLLAMRVPRERVLLLGGGALAGALVFAGAWSLSNHQRLGTWHLTTDTGLILIQGHNPDTKGGLQWSTLAQSEPGPDVRPSSSVEVERNDATFAAARSYGVHHLANELRLILPRTYKLVRDDDAGIRWIQFRAHIWGQKVEERMIALGGAYYFAVLGLALFSAPIWWRSRGRGAPFVLPVLYYVAVFGVFVVGDVRYHVPVVPLATIPAGAAVVAGWEAVRWQPQARTMGPPADAAGKESAP